MAHRSTDTVALQGHRVTSQTNVQYNGQAEQFVQTIKISIEKVHLDDLDLYLDTLE